MFDRWKVDGVLSPTPLSTMTEISRMVEDVWKNDVKPAVAKLNVNIKRELSELGKDIHGLIQSNETTTAAIAKGFSDVCQKIQQKQL